MALCRYIVAEVPSLPEQGIRVRRAAAYLFSAQLHTLDAAPGSARNGRARDGTAARHTTVYRCHESRVKARPAPESFRQAVSLAQAFGQPELTKASKGIPLPGMSAGLGACRTLRWSQVILTCSGRPGRMATVGNLMRAAGGQLRFPSCSCSDANTCPAWLRCCSAWMPAAGCMTQCALWMALDLTSVNCATQLQQPGAS